VIAVWGGGMRTCEQQNSEQHTFALQQTLMGVSNQEWGGTDNYNKRGNDKKCITIFN